MTNHTVALNFIETGKGLPVVLIHGFPFDHTTWEPVVSLLRDEARLILPDLRGFGKSPIPQDAVFTMRMHADDILALLDQLEIERAVLVGHSMGGYVALNFAHAYPHRVCGLGLIATQGAADTPERRQGRMIMAEEIGRRGVKQAAAGMAQKYVADPARVDAIRAEILKANPKSFMAGLKGLAERPNAEDWLANIAIPAVVVAGKKDALIAMEASHTMNQLLGRSWIVEVEDSGHTLPLEAPQAVADALKQLFSSVDCSPEKPENG